MICNHNTSNFSKSHVFCNDKTKHPTIITTNDSDASRHHCHPLDHAPPSPPPQPRNDNEDNEADGHDDGDPTPLSLH
ncbi:hypothetical protein SCLCIDRAFT_27563 [Scleroderma citrinum Foug A]|uniref:Uncharacterized protein n=1 Tax=Scleroderma citrinum Foug A TaxID=1036808 RepID=A0A0C2ZBD5_9AGAM|nr:hypothetical protein SCLCIDRAFT_27563 [Scleroderma citrinum Foug A]